MKVLYNSLKEHAGHKVRIEDFEKTGEVCLICEDCSEVLLSEWNIFEKPSIKEIVKMLEEKTFLKYLTTLYDLNDPEDIESKLGIAPETPDGRHVYEDGDFSDALELLEIDWAYEQDGSKHIIISVSIGNEFLVEFKDLPNRNGENLPDETVFDFDSIKRME